MSYNVLKFVLALFSILHSYENVQGCQVTFSLRHKVLRTRNKSLVKNQKKKMQHHSLVILLYQSALHGIFFFFLFLPSLCTWLFSSYSFFRRITESLDFFRLKTTRAKKKKHLVALRVFSALSRHPKQVVGQTRAASRPSRKENHHKLSVVVLFFARFAISTPSLLLFFVRAYRVQTQEILLLFWNKEDSCCFVWI